jgi:hypothetical protein
MVLAQHGMYMYGPLGVSDLPSDVTLPQFAGLRILQLEFPVDADWNNAQFGPTAQKLLRFTPLSQHLTVLFKARSERNIDPSAFLWPWTIFDSEQLDRNLAHLRSVECCLCFSPSFHGDRAVASTNFPPWMDVQMPGLRGTGLLTCSEAAERYMVWDIFR